jgi:hypothetical protein
VFAIRLRLQWLRARCALPAAKLAGSSFAGSWEEFSAVVGGEGSRSIGIFADLKCARSACHVDKQIAGHATRIRRFKSFSAYGVGAAFASFFPPLLGFTSMSVADIV